MTTSDDDHEMRGEGYFVVIWDEATDLPIMDGQHRQIAFDLARIQAFDDHHEIEVRTEQRLASYRRASARYVRAHLRDSLLSEDEGPGARLSDLLDLPPAPPPKKRVLREREGGR